MMSRSRNAVRKRNELQEQFAQELIQAQENERSRLAMELHDSVGQKIMLLSRKTKSKNDPDMESLAGKTLEELRSISRGLHPPTLNDFGITQTIINLINEIDEHSSIFFTNEIENIDYGNFKNSVPWEDELRHDVYFNVWSELSKLQQN